jgi:hypothetical protein
MSNAGQRGDVPGRDRVIRAANNLFGWWTTCLPGPW